MKKTDTSDPKSPDYFPTISELGYTQEEFNKIGVGDINLDREYEKRLELFQQKHRKMLMNKAVKVRKKKMIQVSWYNVLSENEKEELIIKSIKIADEVIDKVNKNQSLKDVFTYYEKLRIRVKGGKFTLYDADDVKCSKFPKYCNVNKSLTGSAYSFVKLWVHVFSERRIKGNTFTTK